MDNQYNNKREDKRIPTRKYVKMSDRLEEKDIHLTDREKKSLLSFVLYGFSSDLLMPDFNEV